MARKSRKRNISCAIVTDDTMRDIWEIETGNTAQEWIRIWSFERVVYDNEYADDNLCSYLFKLNDLLGQRERYTRLDKEHKEFLRKNWIWFKVLIPIDDFFYNLRIEWFGR